MTLKILFLACLIPWGAVFAQQANTLPIHTKWETETSFDRVLKRIKNEFSFSKTKNQAMAAMIQKHLALGLTMTDSKTYRYQKSLADLRKKALLVVETVAGEYFLLAENRYPARQRLVFMIRELESPAAKPFLKKIIAAKIPAEQSKDLHHFSTVAEEAKIRMMGVNGLEALGKIGDVQVSEELFTLAVFHENRGVRTEAVLGYVALAKNKEEARSRLKEKLKPADRELADLVRIGPEDLDLITKHVAATGQPNK